MLILAFYCHLQLLGPSRFLIWHEDPLASDGDSVTKSEVVFSVFDTEAVRPIADVDAAVAALGNRTGFVSGEEPIATARIPTSLPYGSNPIALPKELGALQELLLLVHSTAGGKPHNGWDSPHVVLWRLIPADGVAEVTPQDWFNHGSYDFGYQWPARVARDPKSGAILGEAIRIGVFQLADDRRTVQRWIHSDVFYHPERG